MLRERLTPAESFYVRNHFAVPKLDAAAWRLRIDGAVERPRDITIAGLAAVRELDVVLECAGNGRTRMEPKPGGTPWGDRAVSCGRFAGVPFAALARACGARSDAVEVVFAGADGDGKRAYERSLPLQAALADDVLVATHLNGAPLAPEHGAPARLVVPGWFGMASVKWLVRATFLTRPFEGFYQKDEYVVDGRPLSLLRVKSLVAPPGELRAGTATKLRGWAWSGHAPVARVDVSTDGGRSWTRAEVEPPQGRYAWQAWSLAWTPRAAGEAEVLSRARDEAGNEQPMAPAWNKLGYANNAVARARIVVAP
jgi:DMSO/TMAO reductase YedYZ molybdopterin-dependent catalytic subunit